MREVCKFQKRSTQTDSEEIITPRGVVGTLVGRQMMVRWVNKLVQCAYMGNNLGEEAILHLEANEIVPSHSHGLLIYTAKTNELEGVSRSLLLDTNRSLANKIRFVVAGGLCNVNLCTGIKCDALLKHCPRIPVKMEFVIEHVLVILWNRITIQ